MRMHLQEEIMKSKVLRVLAFVVATILCITLVMAYKSFKGDPISKYFAKKHLREYMHEHYPTLDYQEGETFFNFKEQTYVMKIDVHHSEDRDFTIYYQKDGKIGDEYEWLVVDKMNMDMRLQSYLNELPITTYIKTCIPEKDINFGLLKPVLDGQEGKYWMKSINYDTKITDMLKEVELEYTVYLNDKNDKYQNEKVENQIQKILNMHGLKVVKVKVQN